jgi:hypothetical protein
LHYFAIGAALKGKPHMKKSERVATSGLRLGLSRTFLRAFAVMAAAALALALAPAYAFSSSEGTQIVSTADEAGAGKSAAYTAVGNAGGKSEGGSGGDDGDEAGIPSGQQTMAAEATPAGAQANNTSSIAGDTADVGETENSSSWRSGGSSGSSSNNGSNSGYGDFSPYGAVPPVPKVSGLSISDIAKVNAQTGNPFIDTISGNVPLGSISTQGAWSALSMLLTAIALLNLLALASAKLVSLFRSRNLAGRTPSQHTEEADAYHGGHMAQLLLAVVASAILTPALWLLLDDLTQPLVFANCWTMAVIVVFVIHLTLLACYTLVRGSDPAPASAAENDIAAAISRMQ